MSADLGILDWALIIAYLIGMLGLGAVLSTRIKGFKDYFLAGGALTTPLLVCTLVSTYYELDVTFGVSETGYHYGIVSWVWLTRPYYLTIIIAALLLTRRIKKMGVMTLPDVLERHYGRGAQIVGALACFIYSLPITALAAMSVMFGVLFANVPASRELGLLISVGVCVAYTVMGGLWADAISDTIQFALMCVSLAVAIPAALDLVGGFEFLKTLPSEHLTATGGLGAGLILAWTLGALTVFVEPAFYQRIFAAKDSRSVMRALIIGVVLWASYDWGVTLIGMIAHSAADSGLMAVSEEGGGKEALLRVCLLTLPIGLKGLFIGGVLAAAMSSVDSYSLLASGNIIYDIYRPLRKKPLSDAHLIRLTRIGVFAVMMIAVAASLAFTRINDAWIFMSSVLASVVLVPVMGALFARPRRAAGLWSAGAGFVTLAAFYVLVYLNGNYDPDAESMMWRIGEFELWREYAVLAALPMSLIGFVIGNLVGRKDARS